MSLYIKDWLRETKYKVTAYQIDEGDQAPIRPARRERKWAEPWWGTP